MKNDLVLIVHLTSACNLRCTYCYGDHNFISELYDENIIIKSIKKCIDYCRHQLKIIFHGGEPLIIGVTKFEHILREISEYAVAQSVKIAFSVQTNLILLTSDYCELFKNYKVKIGTSLDGCDEYQNSSRVNINGDSTFSTVLHKWLKLKDSCNYKDLCSGIIMTVTKKHIGKESILLEFIKKHSLKCNIRPAFPICDEDTKSCMTPKEYATFFCNLFDLWFNDATFSTFDVAEFPRVITAILFKKTKLCSESQNCGGHFLCSDESGSFYSCNRLCGHRSFYLGNYTVDSIADIICKNQEFSQNRYNLLSECHRCKWLSICNCGCPAVAFFSNDNFNSKDYFCEANKSIFEHVENILKEYINNFSFES